MSPFVLHRVLPALAKVEVCPHLPHRCPGLRGVFWGPFRGWMLQPVFFTQSPGQSCLAGRVRLWARKFGRSDLEAVGAVTFFKPFFRSPLHSCYQALVLPMMMSHYMIGLSCSVRKSKQAKKTSRRSPTFIKISWNSSSCRLEAVVSFATQMGRASWEKKHPASFFCI